jgi:hypothetical protein
MLAVVSIWRDVPAVLPPAESAPPGAGRLTAIVLPFEDGTGVPAYAALRRDSDGSLVCSLMARTNHLGLMDEAGLARVLTDELASAGVFADVQYNNGYRLVDGSVVVAGKILEGALRIDRDGKRSYVLAVEMIAERSYGGARVQSAQFWRKVFRGEVKGSGKGAAYEVGELVRKVFGDVAEELGEAVRKQP